MEGKITVRGIEDVDNLLSQIAPRQAQNIMRSTVQGIASEIAKDAKGAMPVESGDMRRGTKAKRRRVQFGKIQSDVMVSGAYYWRFLEYGQGPDGVEYGFFLKAVEKMRANWNSRFLDIFGKKFEAALARARKRLG